MNDDVPWGPLAAVLAVGFMLGFLLGVQLVDRDTQKLKAEAVKHGYAEWKIVDPATGKTEFHWIEPHALGAIQEDVL